MNLISDVVYKTEKYLSLKERLYWSSVNKGYLKLINRTNLKSHITATTLSRYIEYNFPISNEITIREEIESFMGRNDFIQLFKFNWMFLINQCFDG